MIIFEGPDGAGKTSLAVRLSRELGIPIADKVVSSDMTPMTDLAQWTEDNVSCGFQRRIFDRHRLISEPIYGPATRSRQDLRFCDPGWMMEMTARFYACDPIIIYCLPPIQTVRANVNREDTDNAAVKSRIGAIYAGYVARAAIDVSQRNARLFNYQTTLYDDMLRWLQRELDKRNEGFTYDRPRTASVPGPLDHRGPRLSV
jgi:hypothetical protein